MSNDFQFLPTQGALAYTVDWSDEIPEAATLTAVAFTISPQVLTVASPATYAPTLTGQDDELAQGRSTITVSNGQHGQVYVLQGIGTLSTGEQIPKDVGLICSNG